MRQPHPTDHDPSTTPRQRARPDATIVESHRRPTPHRTPRSATKPPPTGGNSATGDATPRPALTPRVGGRGAESTGPRSGASTWWVVLGVPPGPRPSTRAATGRVVRRLGAVACSECSQVLMLRLDAVLHVIVHLPFHHPLHYGMRAPRPHPMSSPSSTTASSKYTREMRPRAT